MDISAIQPIGGLALTTASVAPAEAAQRRQLAQAVASVNQSGMLGNNQLVILVDQRTRHSIIRVEDRETHAVVFQAPPEYVLRLAEDLQARSAQITRLPADM